jgi:signal transduction histidine kinase
VIDYWQAQVRGRVEGAQALPEPIRLNTLPAFYDNIAEAVTASYPRADGTSHTNAMAQHGSERARMTGYRADQVLHEYQLFREAIALVCRDAGIEFSAEQWRVVEDSIDAASRQAIKEFSTIHESMREQLAATLSHDMRTPLSLILAGAQMIALVGTLDEARQSAEKIIVGARRLDSMLSELVDALTVERGERLRLKIAHFDMKTLIDAICQEFRSRGLGNVETQTESFSGYWCENSMRRAVENLITNAFKYGDGGTVRVKAVQLKGRTIVSVHNTGNPIPEDRRVRIFDYLCREGEDRKIPGWGIGLPFVKSVAESHGGSSSVDSSAEAGTTFTIDVPTDCRPYV